MSDDLAQTPYKLAFSLSVIYGAFTLGFYVAIQGPTLMDIIDLLHVNNDIMSYTLAFASLAYAFGGLLSGMLFNHFDRRIIIPGYFIVFGVANAITPYLTNYYLFSAITVFKMMCAGGTDCGANVWILDMWPGQDAWLQALHFSFACGTALGPLVVEPFLSASEHKDPTELELRLQGNNGHALISDQSNESRIYVPYGVSGMTSIVAALILLYLRMLAERQRREQCRQRTAKQLAASGEHILMSAVQHPAAIEAGLASEPAATQKAAQPVGGVHVHATIPEEAPLDRPAGGRCSVSAVPEQVQEVKVDAEEEKVEEEGEGGQEQQSAKEASKQAKQQQQQQQSVVTISSDNLSQLQANQLLSAYPGLVDEKKSSAQLASLQALAGQQQQQQQQDKQVKITSKAKQSADGRPPYYVMVAVALSAMCLSFYCGIEITSMNYLATFAVNIDLQLPKSTAALMSSALTISFAVGRLIAIWIAALMQPHHLFYLCCLVMAAGNLCILFFANTTETLLWVSICLMGVGCGPMYASIVSFYDDRISKVTNTVAGIFILGSMFNVALNSLIIGHYIIDNALILIVCNVVGTFVLLLLFMCLHVLTRIKKYQRKRKFRLLQMKAGSGSMPALAASRTSLEQRDSAPELQVRADQVTVTTPMRAVEIEPEAECEQQPQQQQQQQRRRRRRTSAESSQSRDRDDAQANKVEQQQVASGLALAEERQIKQAV